MEYNDLYEIVRKEKYSETLQKLDKKFLIELCEYLKEMRKKSSVDTDLFSDSVFENKKQLENSIALFRSLILRRKRKLLNLVFVAAETGIMKKDYDVMFDFERKTFDNLVKAFEKGDKELNNILHGKNSVEKEINKMLIINEDISEFVDMEGKTQGPFGKGELANLKAEVGDILVQGGKASFVDG